MKRIVQVLLPLAAVLAAVLYFYAPARLAALVLIGRSPVCPMANAVQAQENARQQIALKDKILAASKRIAKDEHFTHWDTPLGKWWMPNGSDYVLPFNLAEQERNIYGVAPFFVRKGDIVLDCGANIGVFARKALDAGAKTVVAIEIAPENIEALKRNFGPEIAAGRVIVYEKGVWDKDDWLTLNIDPVNSAADSVIIKREGGVEGARVPLTTIDKLVEELKLERVDFIKMDIEGAEQRAIRGGKATIAKWHPRLSLSAYHEPSDPVMIPKLVHEGWDGYKMECGPCAEANGYVRPDILYFQ